MIQYKKPDKNQVAYLQQLLKKAAEEPEPYTSWAWEDGEVRLQTTLASVASAVLERNQFPERVAIQYGTYTITYQSQTGILPEMVIQPPPTVKATFKKVAAKT